MRSLCTLVWGRRYKSSVPALLSAWRCRARLSLRQRPSRRDADAAGGQPRRGRPAGVLGELQPLGGGLARTGGDAAPAGRFPEGSGRGQGDASGKVQPSGVKSPDLPVSPSQSICACRAGVSTAAPAAPPAQRRAAPARSRGAWRRCRRSEAREARVLAAPTARRCGSTRRRCKRSRRSAARAARSRRGIC